MDYYFSKGVSAAAGNQQLMHYVYMLIQKEKQETLTTVVQRHLIPE